MQSLQDVPRKPLPLFQDLCKECIASKDISRSTFQARKLQESSKESRQDDLSYKILQNSFNILVRNSFISAVEANPNAKIVFPGQIDVTPSAIIVTFVFSRRFSREKSRL